MTVYSAMGAGNQNSDISKIVELSGGQFHVNLLPKIVVITYIEDERSEELARYVQTLADYSVSMKDLVDHSPRHRDARTTLFKAAYRLSRDETLMAYLQGKKQLPLNELEKISGVKRKTLERGRKFIIATALIMDDRNEFIYLRSYIDYDLK